MKLPERVALLVTCLVDQLMPDVGVATVKVLRRAGFEVDFPAEQTCCGQPFYNSGFRQQAKTLARRTIDIFADQEVVVLPSGSCTTMIRLEYPHLFDDDPVRLQRARDLASKTYELSEFLTHRSGWSPAAQGADAGKVTYHDSCHMCRMLKLKQEPRALLAAAGCSLHEMEESDRCCGFGGVFSARMPEVSTAMTAEKLRQATATGVDTLVTADPGCLMQMRSLEQDSGIAVRHLASLLEELTR